MKPENLQIQLLKIVLIPLFLLWNVINAAAQNQKSSFQKTIVLMIDGFGEDYYRNSDMPNLNRMERSGIYKVVPSLMPAVTNVNNISIATGELPAKNGMTGNVFLNTSTGKEEYAEDPALILVPTLFQRARKAGIKSALFSVKKKTVDLMGPGADLAVCPECPGAAQTVFAKQFGIPPEVYSKEVTYWIMNSAIFALKNDPELGLIYIHTTDYPMHTWSPQEADAEDFLHHLDQLIGQLQAAAPEAAILITADHGLHHKSKCWDLYKACLNRNLPVQIVISPENDRYVKHHRGMGGSAYVYLKNANDQEAVRKMIQALPGVDTVISRADASREFGLMPERIGDLMVLGDSTTVFGNLETAESEQLDARYRSHGSAYEAHVPLFVYNAKQAPKAGFFTSNYLLAAWLFK